MTASVIMVGLFSVSSGEALIHAHFFSLCLHFSLSAAFGPGDTLVLFLESVSQHPGLQEAFQCCT